MSSKFTLASFVSHIKNGYSIRKKSVIVPYSKNTVAIAQILENEGFIESSEVIEERVGVKNVKIFLKYIGGNSSIREISLVSKPGRRIYGGYRNIKPYIDGLGVKIISTSKGIFTDHQAKELKIGGEVLINIF